MERGRLEGETFGDVLRRAALLRIPQTCCLAGRPNLGVSLSPDTQSQVPIVEGSGPLQQSPSLRPVKQMDDDQDE